MNLKPVYSSFRTRPAAALFKIFIESARETVWRFSSKTVTLFVRSKQFKSTGKSIKINEKLSRAAARAALVAPIGSSAVCCGE